MTNCKIEKNKEGKIINVLNQNNKPSKLFQQILNIPTLSLDEAINVYKNVYSEKIQEKININDNESKRERTRWNPSRGNQTLEGAPIIQGATGADSDLTNIAENYAIENGIDYKRQSKYVEVDENLAKRIAQAYEEMAHSSNNPIVKEAYKNLIQQTKSQYEYLIKNGYVFYFYDETNDPYNGNPWEAMRDLRNNKTMGVFSTEQGYGIDVNNFNTLDNPMLEDTGLLWSYGLEVGVKKRVLANDLFRAVHDAFGHGLEGAGFRARGEENAWQAHARLFTGSAIAAITTETRGQNSWLNFGKFSEQNQTAKIEDTIFAEQKIGLLPEWTWKTNFDEGLEKERENIEKKPENNRTKEEKAFLLGVVKGTGTLVSNEKTEILLEKRTSKNLEELVSESFKDSFLYKWAISNGLNNIKIFGGRGDSEGVAFYNKKEKEISLNINHSLAGIFYSSQNNLEKTLAHEIIHAYIDANVSDTKFKEFESKLLDVTTTVENYINTNNVSITNKKIFNYIKKGAPEEIVTYALTNAEFASLLLEVPSKNNTSISVWEDFLEYIKNLLQQFTDIDSSALGEVLNILSDYTVDSNNISTTTIVEPELLMVTPNGEIFNTYQEAIRSVDEGKIKLNIEEITIAEVDSDTNVDNFEGVINHLVKQGGLTGERILDKNGDIIYVTQGQTETAKQFTAELVEKQAVRLLGRSGVKTTKSGDFIFTDTLNKITINGQEYDKKDIDALNYEELTKKFGKQKALEIELGREYTKALQPTKTKKRLEETSEVKTEDELVVAIKSLLNKLGIKITSIEDYIKHNTLKNDNVAPEAKALMDVVNKIMAFRNGTITREDLIEETMHFIEASLDPKLTEGIRRNISKTAEWKQYSEHYFKIYSKEYSGEKLDEMVRREILGKVMANAVINNFALSQNATLTEQSIFDKIKELLQQFFDTIEAFFKPQYQQQIDALNNDIFAKLMAGTLINEMNTDQNYGTKFRLYSVSNDITNDIVRIQKEAEKALDILRNNITQIGQEDSSQNYTINVAKDLLKKVEEAVKKQDDKEARIEAIATFAKIVNMVQRQTRYLERASKKATQNKHPFSAEEMIVYNNLVSEFYTNIIPTVENILGKQKRPTPAEKRIQEELEKAKNDISELIGTVQNSGFKAKDYVVDLMVTRLGLDKETEEFLRERAEGLQQETNWFFMQFGNLSHSSNVYLNALGHVITKTDGDKREGFQKDLKPFIERISKAGYLKDLSSLADGDYLQSVHLMNDIDNKRLEKEYSLYYELFDKQTGVSNEKVTLEDFKKIDIIDNLDVTYSLEFKKQMDEFELKEYKLSPLNLSTMLEKREKLKNYSQATQDYERNASGRYASIMQQAEIVDGIPLVTQDMRYEIEDLRNLRVYAKSIYDRDGGKLKQGISLSNENESNAIQIGDNLFVTLSENANNDAILAVELSQIDFERIKDNEGKPKSGMTDSFRQMLSKMDAQQAYDFLMLNSYVNYTDEYYNSLNIEPIVTKLENAITDENEGEILPLIEKITAATTQISTILKANKMMNNPSEINFDRMEMSERQSIKDLSQDLEYQYSLARQYLSKEAQQEEEKVISETIPNQAFIDYLVDTGITSRVDYSGVDRLDEDQVDNINKIFNTIEQHSTENKVREILNLKNDVKLFKNSNISKFNNVHKRAFKLTIEEYNSMEAEERFAYMTNELLQYSYTKLLPYFRKSQPIGVDVALTDLRAGVISSEDFLNNYDNGQYEFLKITPNYNFQEATNDNNKNPHFQNAKVNNTPLFRVFEETTTLQDVQTKSVDQLKQEGKLNAYTNIEFLKEYNIDLVELFQTGKEVARSNKDKFEARQALIDLQKISLEKNKVLGKHNLYLLPQKEASKTRKFDKYLKSGKNFKTIYEEIFNFREDDADLGQDAGKAKVSSSDGNYSIPKYGLRRLKNAPVTDDLLESYTWMNYKANEHQARRQNVGDAMAVSEALMGSEFEGNIQKTTSNLYKTFKESMDYNFFGVKEVWSSQFKLFGIQMDYAKLLRNFGQLIRFRNLGFTLISPITSAITGSIFLRIESLVGQTVDKDALRKANSFFTEHAGAAAREMLGLEPKAMLNSLGESWGWHDSLERYENSMYGKGIRGIQKSAFAAHSMANFPINTRVGLAVLANSRFVEGEMLEYKQFAQKNKGKSEKEIRGLWANYTSVLDVVEVQKNGVITYNYTKVADSLNNNFTEEEAKNFMDDKRTVIKGRIKAAIQNVDGQISTEDKSMSTRNVFFSFMNIHRSWLMIAVQNKLKYKQVNLATGHIEEGSWRTVLGDILPSIIKEARQSGVVNALTKMRGEYKNYDDYKKRAISRTLWEAGVLNLLIGLTLLGIKELDDDDEDSWLFKTGALFTFRTTNEVASSTVALPRNIYDTLNGIIVGLNTIQIATDAPDLFSSDIVERGRYKSLTERERYFFKHIPMMRDYNNLWRDTEGNIKSYNYFNFTQSNTLDWMPTTFLLKEVINEEE